MRNTLIAASALALLAGGANAAVLNYTSTSGAVSTSPSGSGSIFAASFNDALGTLLSATYQITFAPAANGTLTNNSGATGS